MERVTSAAIPLNFDPGQLLLDADTVLDGDANFESWWVLVMGGRSFPAHLGATNMTSLHASHRHPRRPAP